MSPGMGIRPFPVRPSLIPYNKKGCDFMNEYHLPSQRSWTPEYEQDQFPGIEDTFSGPPAVIHPTVLPAQTTAAVAKGGLPFNLSNLSDLKAMVDRMGGIEGLLSTMGKFQKFMASVQQIAPMLKLFMGNKGNKAATPNKAKGKRIPSRKRRTSNSAASKARTRLPAKRR
jgi:hypothetical protein